MIETDMIPIGDGNAPGAKYGAYGILLRQT